MTSAKKAVFLSLCFLLFTFGYIVSTGFYHVGELIIILLVTQILLLFYFKPQILSALNLPADKKSLNFILPLILTVNIALAGARLGDAGQSNWQFYSMYSRILAGFALILALSIFLKKIPMFLVKYRLVLLIAIAFLIRLFSIISAPNPPIDVFYILRDGPKELLSGRNPYELSYPAPYGVYIPTILFVYGPLTPFIFIPSVLLFDDPRYTLPLLDLASAFLLYKIASHLKVEKKISSLLITIFLFHPLFPFMTQQAWLEPLMTFFLILAVYLFLKYPRRFFGGLPLGAMVAVKSVYLLPLLTLLLNRKSTVYQYGAILLLPVLFSLPFLLANPSLFLERTQVYVTDPAAIGANLAPTHISLSISAVILKYTKIVIPTIVVAGLGLITAFLTIKKSAKTLPFALLSTFLVFMVLFMFGPFVFLHYFAFMGNILILAVLFFLGQKVNTSKIK